MPPGEPRGGRGARRRGAAEAAHLIRAYAEEDASLEQLLAQLEEEADAVRGRLGESERNSMFAVASSVVRSKRPDGGSWRP